MSESIAVPAESDSAPVDIDIGADAPAPEIGGDDAPEAEAAEPDPERRRGLIAEAQGLRQRLRESEERSKRLEQITEVGNQRLQELVRHLTPQKEAAKAPELPDMNTDPVGHFKARTEQLEAQLRQVQQPMQQHTAKQRFVGAYAQAAQQFKANAPDFDDAYKHVITELSRDAQITGISAEEAEAEFVRRSFQAGVNPAARIYEYAKARGFKGAPPPAQAALQNVETLARGEAASSSLSRGGGAAPKGLTLEALANMSQDEYGKVFEKNPDAVRRLYR